MSKTIHERGGHILHDHGRHTCGILRKNRSKDISSEVLEHGEVHVLLYDCLKVFGSLLIAVPD